MNTQREHFGRRDLVRRTISAVVVVALMGMIPVSASASDDAAETEDTMQVFSIDQCSNGFFCVWSGANYTGSFTQTASTTAVPTAATTWRSVWNRSPKAARVYSGTNSTGTSVCYAPGARSSSTSVLSRTIVLQSGAGC